MQLQKRTMKKRWKGIKGLDGDYDDDDADEDDDDDDDDEAVVLDANRERLRDGDSVVLVKNLKVGSAVLKRGARVKSIRLVRVTTRVMS